MKSYYDEQKIIEYNKKHKIFHINDKGEVWKFKTPNKQCQCWKLILDKNDKTTLLLRANRRKYHSLCNKCRQWKRAEIPLKSGYLEIRLMINNIKLLAYAHRFVFISKVGFIPAGMEINHLNGIKYDNRIENLEVVTRQENITHAKDVLKVKFGNKNKHRPNKLTDEEKLLIKKRFELGERIADINKDFAVSRSTIQRAIYGRKS